MDEQMMNRQIRHFLLSVLIGWLLMSSVALAQVKPPIRVLAIAEAGGVHQPFVRAAKKRLATLGFIPGERVKVLALGLFGADPVLVQIGFTRFALRRTEADRIQVEVTA